MKRGILLLRLLYHFLQTGGSPAIAVLRRRLRLSFFKKDFHLVMLTIGRCHLTNYLSFLLVLVDVFSNKVLNALNVNFVLF